MQTFLKASPKETKDFTAPDCSHKFCGKKMFMHKPYQTQGIDIEGKKIKLNYGYGWTCPDFEHSVTSRTSLRY